MADDNGNGNGTGGGNMTALQRLLDERTATIVRIGAKLRDAKKALKDLQAERDEAVRARDEATVAAAKAAREFDAHPLKADLEKVRGELRERDHRAVFDRVAKERGVADDAIDLVYRHSGYKPEGDAADPGKIGELLDGLKGQPGVSRLFGEPAAPGSPSGPPPGSGQGRRDQSPGKWRVTTDQLADGAWCMANADRLRQARKDGTFEIVSSQ